MTDLRTLDRTELENLYSRLEKQYLAFKSKNLALNMSRGKPSPDQLELSSGLFDSLDARTNKTADNIDVRNYGGVDGIREAKELFAEIFAVRPSEVIVGGNSSLTMMYDTISRALLKGVRDSELPWGKLPQIKFLCPSPGYDRHFAICEALGIEMIPIDMLDDGPDMDKIEELVRKDDTIKGIWCVPKYSNPGGIIYSDEVVDRLAMMETKAADFKIFWDDAYTVHHLTDNPPHLKNILQACSKAGHADRVFIFASTSKVTFPGSGVAAMAASEANIKFILDQLSVQMIGPDKINQLRHVRFLKNLDHINEHMKKHAKLIKPKFDLVLHELEAQLGDQRIASWSNPKGGYFISLNTLDGCAAEVVKRAAAVGVKLTKAGATFPYGKDPKDRNIRIAPTFPSLAELKMAIDVLCLCVQMVSVEKLLTN
ncbi:aminotransferase class I/II-fold pyridoxal phosphate-dependent enzyme [Sporolactobacillus spathodeae]|uniref:Aspartate/methionine/tyrosine aminotransferase n=1 Tax=Sporolactobacillus spathodeae TaxID=1465502 RepID=A0ABS2QA85_9BACL|nr:aminotransferase class I/II-fold pyridoxal phosphate-dependent enzyme [Sporolactobacillus spathodeae]MBM7658660.1 aspartate/methionine/tyrosine aminotransferase [Sporolactobacillus spathodeae]